MARPRRRKSPLTYRHLRDAAWTALGAASVLATVVWGVGPDTAGVAAAGAAAVLAAAAGLAARLRAMATMDSTVIDWIARARPALLLSGLGAVALFVTALLAVPLSGWSAWIAFAAPLAWATGVRSAFLVSAADGRILGATALANAALLLCHPGWGPRLALATCALLALAAVVSDRLWERTGHGVLKGKVAWRDWLAQWGGPAAALAAFLGISFAAMPEMRPAWRPGVGRPAGGPLRVVVEWPDRGGEPATGPRRTAAEGSSTDPQPPPGTVVVRPPSFSNAAALLRRAAEILTSRGPRAAAVLAGAAAVFWLLRRLLALKRALKGGAGETLREVVASARRRRREAAPPPVPEEPREAVVFLYNELRETLDRHGYKRQPHLAPREYARYLAVRLTDQKDPIERVTALFEAARYGPIPLDVDSRRQMLKACAALRARVGGGASPRAA